VPANKNDPFMQHADARNQQSKFRLTAIVVGYLLLCCILDPPSALAEEAINTDTIALKPLLIHTHSDSVKEYHLFLQGRDPLALSDYRMPEGITRRVILEMLLLQQALHYGGIKQALRFQPYSDNYQHTLQQVSDGRILMHADTFWQQDLSTRSNDLYLSSPTIEHGQYIVGLYSSPENQRALESNKENLSQLSAASNIAWSADWQALEALDLKQLHNVRHWRMMASMVMKQDVDFLLAPFQGTKSQVINRGKFNLVPIPHIKLALNDSRHYAISKKHSAGEQVYKAINRGIETMKRKGIWLRAYRESGVFDPNVDNWQLLNPTVD
jgi:hypothetical protein